jgi:gas vesicle protein
MADSIQTLPNTKNDLIVSAVQKNLIEKSVFAPTVRDVSQFAIKGAQSFSVPKLSNFAVTNRAFGAAADSQALVDSSDKIDLDFNAYIAWLYDSRDVYQSTIEYRVEAAMRASLSHAKYVDEQLLATIDAVAAVEVSKATFTTVKEQVLELRRQLLQNGSDISRMTIAIGVDKEAEMLAEADFVRADFYGSANVRTGQIGQLYGIPVVISRLITGDEMKMYDADGIGLAFQGGVEMSDQKANEYGANSMRTAMDQVFGVGGLELGEQGAGATLSPLVGKLVA